MRGRYGLATTPSGSTTPVITVGITPTDPAATGSLDQAPVEVSITTASISNALAVPVAAAPPGSGAARHALDAACRAGDRAAEATALSQLGSIDWRQSG